MTGHLKNYLQTDSENTVSHGYGVCVKYRLLATITRIQGERPLSGRKERMVVILLHILAFVTIRYISGSI